MQKVKKIFILVFYWWCIFGVSKKSWAWGFFVHRYINRYVIFTLPPPLFKFYKHYLGYITVHSVDPDKRRAFDISEKERHFIDLDVYTKDADNAVEVFENFLRDEERKHGILPLNIIKVKMDLTNAFKKKDVYKILKLSAYLGHYIGDLHVPLHTTSNYDGQRDGQEGVHTLWESRIPELFFHDNVNFFLPRATYINEPLQVVWETVFETNQLVEKLLKMERLTSRKVRFGTHCYENKNSYSKKVYSKAYVTEFYKQLNGQVEHQLLKSIKMLGDFLFTCWLDAGSPDLSSFVERKEYIEAKNFPKDKYENDEFMKKNILFKEENDAEIGKDKDYYSLK